MHDTEYTTPDREPEQIHGLSAGFREVADLLGVPAGIPDERDDRDLVDPDDVRESIIGPAAAGVEDSRGGLGR